MRFHVTGMCWPQTIPRAKLGSLHVRRGACMCVGRLRCAPPCIICMHDDEEHALPVELVDSAKPRWSRLPGPEPTSPKVEMAHHHGSLWTLRGQPLATSVKRSKPHHGTLLVTTVTLKLSFGCSHSLFRHRSTFTAHRARATTRRRRHLRHPLSRSSPNARASCHNQPKKRQTSFHPS